MKEDFLFSLEVERELMKSKRIINLIVHVAIFGALAIILYCVPYLQFSLPFCPSFLKIHFDEIPILLAGYAFGPLEAILIIILKALFKLIQDIPETGGIGVLADIIYSSCFILPAVFIYKKHRTLKGAIVSILIGIASQLLVSCVVGLYLIYPLYGLYFYPQAKNYMEAMDVIGSLFTPFDKTITNATDPRIMYKFLLPFNLIKDGIVAAVAFVCYKPLRILIERNNK